MSRAGIKQKRKPAEERRAPTNLTLPVDLRDWGVAHAKQLGIKKASLSELITRLLEAEKAKADSAKLMGAISGEHVDADAIPLALLQRAREKRPAKT